MSSSKSSPVNFPYNELLFRLNPLSFLSGLGVLLCPGTGGRGVFIMLGVRGFPVLDSRLDFCIPLFICVNK